MSAHDPLVLIVEDEPQMRRFLRAALTSRPFRIVEASTAAEAVVAATSHNPELVLLDLGLPDGDGIELTRRLRGWSAVPIIVISARGRETDKVEALDAGADDYLTKPFGLDELLARMRVALRHARDASGGGEPVVEVGGLRIDLDRREVAKTGEPIKLTPIEFRLLAYLARHAGRVVTHAQILREVWGGASTALPHHVRVHMADLRSKIEDDPARPKLLITELGVGYRLRE
ncbi:MAG TPA: response regulator [Candidatus Polarisedimenticolaceae bacterium]|nr:response regulator [Candidatus Polarisedimenticolaceae bacterium]